MHKLRVSLASSKTWLMYAPNWVGAHGIPTLFVVDFAFGYGGRMRILEKRILETRHWRYTAATQSISQRGRECGGGKWWWKWKWSLLLYHTYQRVSFLLISEGASIRAGWKLVGFYCFSSSANKSTTYTFDQKIAQLLSRLMLGKLKINTKSSNLTQLTLMSCCTLWNSLWNYWESSRKSSRSVQVHEPKRSRSKGMVSSEKAVEIKLSGIQSSSCH